MPKRHTGISKSGSLFRAGGGTGREPMKTLTAAHPGYKNPKQAKRGGSKAEIARAAAAEAAISKLARENKKAEERQALIDRAEEIKEKAQERQRKAEEAKAKRAADAEKRRVEAERKINARHLKAQRNAQRAADKERRAATKRARAEARARKAEGKAAYRNRNK